MTEMGSNISSKTATASVTKFTATILANQNGVTITHNLGSQVKVNGIYSTDLIGIPLRIINETANSFDVCYEDGVYQSMDINIGGTYS